MRKTSLEKNPEKAQIYRFWVEPSGNNHVLIKHVVNPPFSKASQLDDAHWLEFGVNVINRNRSIIYKLYLDLSEKN